MKTLLIIAGILLVLWLGFSALDRNRVNDSIDGHEKRIEQLENQQDYNLNDGDLIDEDNPMDKTEDNLDKQEDKIDKKIEMPYENEKTNENTDLKKDDNPTTNDGVNNRAGKVRKPNPAKANEPEANASDSIVAFGYVNDYMFEPATEAFKLNLFDLAFLGEDSSVTAFQLK
jgi:hypothetical protein